MSLRRTCLALVPVLGILVASTGASGAPSGRTVVLEDIAFSPANLTVRKGTIVSFSWRDGATPHNVVSRGRLRFRSTGDRTEGTHRIRPRRPGTYTYVCTIHPVAMKGRITVR